MQVSANVVAGVCVPASAKYYLKAHFQVTSHHKNNHFLFSTFRSSLCCFIPFRELHCVPDVFSLVEWSDWLTPSSYQRRFDTVFYLCCTNAKPDISHDNLEVSHAEVCSVFPL